MALVVNDRVQEVGTANTTVSFTLTGAVASFQSFAVVGNGNTTFYAATDGIGQWEVGIGTYSTTGPTLARTTILSSSNAGSAVTFSGAVNVFITYPSEKSVNLNAAGVAEIGSPLGYADTGIIATFASTVAGYNQVAVQNLSNSTGASTNFNVANNVGTSGSNYAEFGINSSTFIGTGAFGIASAAYVASASTDLSVGTYGAYPIHFVTNTSATDTATMFSGGGMSLNGATDPGVGNLKFNNYVAGFGATTASAGNTTLLNTSGRTQVLIGSTTHSFTLPDATTVSLGQSFIFVNNSSGALVVKNNAGTTIESVPSGGVTQLGAVSISTSVGSWGAYSFIPAACDWGTNSLNLATTVVTGGTWNGGTIQPAYGGTGLTTFSAANNALYSTGTTTLTAGTLPILAGGTGASNATDARTNLGLGTIATQNANSVAITGGSVNGTTVGATTASTGAFTTLSSTAGASLATSSGNVGIGTSSPGALLTVLGTTGNTQDGVVRFKHPGNSSFGTVLTLETIAGTDSPALGFKTYNGGSPVYYSIAQSPSGALTFNSGAGIGGFGTERMRIDSAGNVGIGTTSPSGKLSVSSSSYPTGTVESSSTNLAALSFTNSNAAATTWAVGVQGGQYQTAGNFSVNLSGVGDALTINSSRNVGIGTSSPDEILHIYKITDPAFRIQSSAGNCYVVNRSGLSSMEFLNVMNGPMTFFTNSAERMRIDSSGVLLVGTTATFDNVSYLPVQVLGGLATKIAGTALTTQMSFFNDNGRVGYIGTGGTSTSYNTSSDYRLKEDWQPMTGASERVQALKPVNFAWKSDGSRVDGFLAHEAQEVVPECVTGEKDAVDKDGKPNYQGIDQSKLVPLLTAALQEALTKIDSLTVRIEALEGN